MVLLSIPPRLQIGYCVSLAGLDENKIRKYVKYQEEKEKKEESGQGIWPSIDAS